VRLAARGVVVTHGSRHVLAGIDLAVESGQFVLLAGRNGAGKSTLLRVLLGVQPPNAGAVDLDGQPLREWLPQQRARRLAFVPQEPDCPFEFTGRQLVAMGRHAHRGRWQAMRPEDLTAIERSLAQVDASAFADRPVTSLSGGELRRIAVARALCTEAPALLLDEPTSNLDLQHALELAALLRRLAATGYTLVVASHDLNLLASSADRVVLLHEGRVFADAEPSTALCATNIATVFGVAAIDPSGYFPRDFALLDGARRPFNDR